MLNPFEPGLAHEEPEGALDGPDWVESKHGMPRGPAATGRDGSKRPEADSDANPFEEEEADEDEAGMFDYDEFVDDAEESVDSSPDADEGPSGFEDLSDDDDSEDDDSDDDSEDDDSGDDDSDDDVSD